MRPYIGAGVNFILSFADDAARPADADLDSAWSPALQAGLDIDIPGGWFVNLDVTYLKIDSKAALRSPGPSGAVDIDPIVIGLGAASTTRPPRRSPAQSNVSSVPRLEATPPPC